MTETPNSYNLQGSRLNIRHTEIGITYQWASTTTAFISEPNLSHLATMAAELPADADGILRIAEPGCSLGKETWSLAALLSRQEIDFRIDAMDINPVVLEHAQQPYPHNRAELERLDEHGLLEYFDVCPQTFRPSRELRERVIFREPTDIRTTSLAPEQYGAVVMNQLLVQYSSQGAAPIIANVVKGMLPGAVLVTNNWYQIDSSLSKLARKNKLVSLAPESQDRDDHPLRDFFRLQAQGRWWHRLQERAKKRRSGT